MATVTSSSPARTFPATETLRPAWDVPPQQIILALVLVCEAIAFSLLGEHFFKLPNLLTIGVQNVELGLLALALTPVILTGGIDLSVGSLVGLCAVAFGMLSRDAHWPWPLAAGGAIGVSLLGGLLNALQITR